MRFCCSPIEIKGDGRVESIVLARNELVRDESGAVRARDTGEREELECGLVFRSIGYRGVAIEGVPFDDGRGLIPNRIRPRHQPGFGRTAPGPLRGRLDQARALRRDRHEQEGRPRNDRRPARGPRKQQIPVASSASPAGVSGSAGGTGELLSIEELLVERAGDHVTYFGWQAIDAAEVAAGEPHGRPRVKFATVAEMVEASRAAEPA